MKKYIISIALAIVAIVGVKAQDQRIENALRKINYAEVAISSLYVDSVDDDKLAESAIKGMLKELDPHSSYTNAEDTKRLNEPLEGNFEGIGVQFNILEDSLVVIQAISKGPSEKAGIMPGDRIVSVDDTIIAGVKRDRTDIMKRLRGKKGTKVTLKIVRRGVKDLLTFVITRDKIPVYSVDAKYIIRPGVGFIRISSFGATTADEVSKAIDELKAMGMKNLILDLESNSGGYMDAAIKVASQFLQNGEMVVYTEGRRFPTTNYRAEGGGKFLYGKVVVLVDEYTASAAEIVSGAIQDHDRGQIVGRHTFGKGLVQRPTPLPDGSLIRITVSHYYTPSGRCIQKPYKKGDREDYDLDVINRLKRGELTNKDSIHFSDSLKFKTLKEGRTVYGGGGIMPDHFIPLDTLAYTKYYRDLRLKSVVLNASLKYIDVNRKKIKKEYKTFEKFNEKYEAPKEYIDAIIKAGKEAKVEPKDDAELEATMPKLKMILKALVARDIWNMSEYYQIVNEESETVKKAIELCM